MTDAVRDETGVVDGTPLYVHLPFCAAKCHYCDFFSVPDEGQDVEGTVGAVLAEAAFRAPRHPRTVYVGGGTPSLLSGAMLQTFLDGLHEVCGFRDSAREVTVECNPESLDEKKARRLVDLGVSRVSIGFQSLHDEVLKLFGRVHGVADSFRAYEAARAAAVPEVNVDLIFAVPDQDPASWERDLARVLALGPDHLSAYNLTFEEDTLFKRWLDQGRLAKAPEGVELEMFHATRRVAGEQGYRAYEISNFSLSGRECHHNLNYWRNGPYVGLGPSAVSKVGVRRFGNLRRLGDYRRSACAGRTPTSWEESPGPEARLGETWWLGLRLAEGLEPSEARRRAGLRPAEVGSNEPPADRAVEVAERLAGHGLLELVGGRYRLTDRGLPLADAIAREFLVTDPLGAAGTAGAAPRRPGDQPHETDMPVS